MRNRQLMQFKGRDIVIETIRNNARARGIKITLERVDGNLYDARIVNHTLNEEEEYSIKVFSFNDGRTEVRIPIPKVFEYTGTSIETGVKLLIFFVDFKAGNIYNIPLKRFKRIARIFGNHYCVPFDKLDLYSFIDEEDIEEVA